MKEFIKNVIEKHGERWASYDWMDRVNAPILVSVFLKGPIFELTLPPNEGHPFWRVNEREATADEIAELAEVLRTTGQPVGTLIPANSGFDGSEGYYRFEFYVKNGRKPNWGACGSFVDVVITEAKQPV